MIDTTLPNIADRGQFHATTQKENFYIGTRVKVLKFKDGKKLINIRFFFVVVINKLKTLFKDYSSNATDNLLNLTIKLPIDKKGNSDWDYMDKYIEEMKKMR